ncbi:hypothetical protein CARUB_v10018856mg, partial [Capsella rubella]
MASIPVWSRHDDKRFELALKHFSQGSQDSQELLKKIALHIEKPYEEVKEYYLALVYDVGLIESGRIAIPKYDEDYYVPLKEATESKSQVIEKAKGTPWSAEEHSRFLDGLKKYGKGDWKNIARECVKSRSPTQVASHAQKYFLRQSSDSKKGKRSSIHDMTLGHTDNVTDPTGSNMSSMDQQPHSVDQPPLD